MARIEAYPARGLLVRLAYWFCRRRYGRVVGPVGIFAHSRPTLSAVAGFELAFERGRAAPARLKELAMVKVATLIGCRFCIDIGSSLARAHGLTEEELLDLPYHQASSRLSDLDKRVLDYASAMTHCPVVVPDELYAHLQAALGREAMVELTAAIAWENYRARFNHAVGLREEGFPGSVVCLLPPAAHAVPESAGASSS
jgi:AhpD family alkylhydroperoxidase